MSHIKELRNNLTKAEQRLWFYLRDRRFLNKKFRRQYPVGQFIVDFYCAQYHLVVELDGGHHAQQEVSDAVRTQFLESKRLTILRFWNNEVMGNIDGVLKKISEQFKTVPQSLPLPSPRSRGEGQGEGTN